MQSNFSRVFVVLFASFVTSACSNSSQFTTSSSSVSDEAPGTLADVPAAVYKFEALAWESKTKPERKAWSDFAFQVISEEYQRLNRAADIEYFCPRYSSLSKEQRINVWGQFFAGVSYFESGWSPTSRMQETTQGTDKITGQPVYSEGLLQLSYQDVQWASYCEFEWPKDKNLASSSPQKTILDPFKNLSCGIKILARQIDKYKYIVMAKNVYWAVLRDPAVGKYSKVSQIATYTKKLSFCQ